MHVVRENGNGGAESVGEKKKKYFEVEGARLSANGGASPKRGKKRETHGKPKIQQAALIAKATEKKKGRGRIGQRQKKHGGKRAMDRGGRGNRACDLHLEETCHVIYDFGFGRQAREKARKHIVRAKNGGKTKSLSNNQTGASEKQREKGLCHSRNEKAKKEVYR